MLHVQKCPTSVQYAFMYYLINFENRKYYMALGILYRGQTNIKTGIVHVGFSGEGPNQLCECLLLYALTYQNTTLN